MLLSEESCAEDVFADMKDVTVVWGTYKLEDELVTTAAELEEHSGTPEEYGIERRSATKMQSVKSR